MTLFRMKNERIGDTDFRCVSREAYKWSANLENQRGRGGNARFGTEYIDGVPVKDMTLLRRTDHDHSES